MPDMMSEEPATEPNRQANASKQAYGSHRQSAITDMLPGPACTEIDTGKISATAELIDIEELADYMAMLQECEGLCDSQGVKQHLGGPCKCRVECAGAMSDTVWGSHNFACEVEYHKARGDHGEPGTEMSCASEGHITAIEKVSAKLELLKTHLRMGHPNFDEQCEACVQAYMRAKRALRGAMGEKEREMANLDTMFHAGPDNNGDLYSLNMVVLRSRLGMTAQLRDKSSRTTANAFRKMKRMLEAKTAPGRAEDWRLEGVRHDPGSEFKGAFHINWPRTTSSTKSARSTAIRHRH